MSGEQFLTSNNSPIEAKSVTITVQELARRAILARYGQQARHDEQTPWINSLKGDADTVSIIWMHDSALRRLYEELKRPTAEISGTMGEFRRLMNEVADELGDYDRPWQARE